MKVFRHERDLLVILIYCETIFTEEIKGSFPTNSYSISDVCFRFIYRITGQYVTCVGMDCQSMANVADRLTKKFIQRQRWNSWT